MEERVTQELTFAEHQPRVLSTLDLHRVKMGTSGLGLLTQEDSSCCMLGEINNSMDIFNHVR